MEVSFAELRPSALASCCVRLEVGWNAAPQRVIVPYSQRKGNGQGTLSRVARECCPKIGGACLQRLNTAVIPIANKYREGTMKSTLERE